MTDQERHALESTITRLATELHETEKRLAPINKERAALKSQLTEQRNRNEEVIRLNAGIQAEIDASQSQIAAAKPIVEIVNSERDRAREYAHEVLRGLVLVPSERQKREQMILDADTVRRIRMWTGVWEAERARPTPTAAPQHQLAMGVL